MRRFRVHATLLVVAILALVWVTGCDEDKDCPSCPETGTGAIVVRADGSGDYPTIQDAIDAADSTAVIELADGIFTGEGNRDLDFLGKPITLRSQSLDPEICIIDVAGSDEDPHFGIMLDPAVAAPTRIEGLTIRNGFYGGGAAINCGDSSPTIANCIFTGHHVTLAGAIATGEGAPSITGCRFTGNSGGGGSAIFASRSNVLIEGCSFSDNTAQESAAAFASEHGSPTLRNCTFTGNHANDAAAIYSFYDEGPVFDGLVITGNVAIELGGGMVLEDVRLAVVHDCIITGNSAAGAGGVHVAGSVAMVGCTVANNTAEYGAGVLYVGGSLAVVNGTFYGNQASLGGGLFCSGSDPVSLTRTIIAFNQGGAVGCAGEPEITLACCDIHGNPGGDWVECIAEQAATLANISLDPLFCDPENGVWTLHYNSPCGNDSCGVIGAWPAACD